jgi:hypothetical protein
MSPKETHRTRLATPVLRSCAAGTPCNATIEGGP